jgi:hypothetical protein
LNTAQPDAATRAPARAARAPSDESGAQESLSAHAMRVLRARLSAMACGVLDPCIALLRQLRKHAGGVQDADAEDGEGRSRPRNARPGGGRDAEAPADEAEAPKPKRRLLAGLIYLSVLLAGGMGGGALAYELLAKLLDRQGTENRRLTVAISKLSKSTASNQKSLDEAKAKRAEAEKKLEEAQKKQTEAEKKFDESLNDTKAAAEKQKKLDEAVKLLDSIRRAERPGNVPRSPPVSGAERKPGPPKSGDCTLVSGNVDALKDCVANLNR